ncbi:MAG: rRNA pseudouridine synthase [Lachnospiraceae bacterium]|nr:rRNA pseudouridine synthase [Lachnospiraceae bacterium]
MIRLDKFLCEMEIGTRSQVKEMIKKGQVSVNNEVIKKADYKFDENSAKVCVKEKEISYQKFYYYMLNKPAGVVSATTDNHDKTVLDLLKDAPGKDLFPVGRLDKDTEGLLLITNDGVLSHNLLSPKKHVDKTYLVKTAETVTLDMIHALEQGVDIGEEKITLPAKVKLLEEKEIELTIMEGKFHQVKRMLKAVGNEVVYLKRLSMGSLILDEALNLGEYRILTEKEVDDLKKDKQE